MKYLMMIYADEVADSAFAEKDPQAFQAMIGEYMRFTTEVKDKGLHAAGNALQPTSTATSVRVRDGKVLLTDGPFAETKEQLAGFYLLECANLDQALEYAAKIPGAKRGTIEVRPIMVYS